MKTLKKIQKLIKSLQKRVDTHGGYSVEIRFRSSVDPQYHKWFSIKFGEYAIASNWAEKVIDRFERHNDFPLDMVLIVEPDPDKEKYSEVIDSYFFPEKVYYAIIEIYKMYSDDLIDPIIWRKPCESRKEALTFIDRVGTGKKGLYRVNYAHIYVE